MPQKVPPGRKVRQSQGSLHLFPFSWGSLQPTVCYPTSESCCFRYFVPYSSCLQQEGEFAPSNFTKTEARCYSFSRNPLQYTEHSNTLHVDFLRVLQRKILCLEIAPPEVLFVPAWGHAFRDYTFYSDRPACLTFLAMSYSSSAGAFLNRVSFARRAASQTLSCWRLARQPSEETGEHASHPPPQSKGWRMGDKWRSRLVWGVGSMARGDWKKCVIVVLRRCN